MLQRRRRYWTIHGHQPNLSVATLCCHATVHYAQLLFQVILAITGKSEHGPPLIIILKPPYLRLTTTMPIKDTHFPETRRFRAEWDKWVGERLTESAVAEALSTEVRRCSGDSTNPTPILGRRRTDVATTGTRTDLQEA